MGKFANWILKKEEIQEYNDALEDFYALHLNYAVSLYDDMRNNSKERHSDLIIGLFFRELIETLDGIRILYRENCIKPSIPILRMIFELYLEIKFLLSDESEIENKARVYELCIIHTEIKKLERQGIEDYVLLQKYYAERDSLFEEMTPDYQFNVIKNLKNKVNDYEPKWYGVVNKKYNSLYELAKKVNEQDLHKNFYKELSKHAHGYMPRYRLLNREGKNCFEPLRSPKGAALFSEYCHDILLNIYALFTDYYLPESSYGRLLLFAANMEINVSNIKHLENLIKIE